MHEDNLAARDNLAEEWMEVKENGRLLPEGAGFRVRTLWIIFDKEFGGQRKSPAGM
jgi:hypothetical protein